MIFRYWHKPAGDKIGVPKRNPYIITEPGWEIKLEGQVKKLWQEVKMLKKKNTRGYVGIKEQNLTADKSDDAIWIDKLKEINERR